jgi:hypothetical protein
MTAVSSMRRRCVWNGAGSAASMACVRVCAPATGLGASGASVITRSCWLPASSQAAFAIAASGRSAVPSKASMAFASLSFKW